MSATKLKIYNDALLICGEAFLSSLTEERESRRLLDQVWDSNGVKACLEMGQWFFAMRTVQIDYDTDSDPDFGFARVFDKPTDWVLTSAVCSDEFFKVPLTRYVDEAGFWYSDLDTIYVRYVSDDENYGNNLSLWPQAFADAVAAHFASKIILKLTSDPKRIEVALKLSDRQLRRAKSNSAMAGPAQFMAEGNWNTARRGSNRRDGGSRTSLTQR